MRQSFASGKFQQHMKTAPRVKAIRNLLCYYPPGQLHVTRCSGEHFCSTGVSSKDHRMQFVIIHNQSSDLKVANGPK